MTDLVLDRFAGPGGWDTGLRYAGYTGRILGVEHDLDACRTAVAAGHLRICADVRTFPIAHLRGRVVGVIESPPCTTFSTAGDGAGKDDLPYVLRLIDDFAAGRTPGAYPWRDERSALTAEPMRSAVLLRPRWIALEQVPAVLPIWQYLAEHLRRLGYRVWCGVLGAEEYGVPQTRRRAILVASLDGPVGPPAPTHQAYRAGRGIQVDDDLFGSPLPAPVSMAQALGWTSSGRPAALLAAGRTKLNDRTRPRPIELPAPTVAFGHADMSWSLAPAGTTSTMVDPRPVTQPAHTITGKATAAWIHDRPSTTVCGDYRIGRLGHKDRDKGEAQFAKDSVQVSVQEAGILQSFPADYPWQGTKTAQYRQVGDAVPPLLAAAVVRPLLAAAARPGVAA